MALAPSSTIELPVHTCHNGEITAPSSLTAEVKVSQGGVGDESLGYGPGPIIPNRVT